VNDESRRLELPLYLVELKIDHVVQVDRVRAPGDGQVHLVVLFHQITQGWIWLVTKNLLCSLPVWNVTIGSSPCPRSNDSALR